MKNVQTVTNRGAGTSRDASAHGLPERVSALVPISDRPQYHTPSSGIFKRTASEESDDDLLPLPSWLFGMTSTKSMQERMSHPAPKQPDLIKQGRRLITPIGRGVSDPGFPGTDTKGTPAAIVPLGVHGSVQTVSTKRVDMANIHLPPPGFHSGDTYLNNNTTQDMQLGSMHLFDTVPTASQIGWCSVREICSKATALGFQSLPDTSIHISAQRTAVPGSSALRGKSLTWDSEADDESICSKSWMRSPCERTRVSQTKEAPLQCSRAPSARSVHSALYSLPALEESPLTAVGTAQCSNCSEEDEMVTATERLFVPDSDRSG